MNIFKRIVSVICALAITAIIIVGYNHCTDGFSIGELRSSIPYYAHFDFPQESNKEQAATILDQKFTYMNKGCQFYAFASADGKYVLKFFKHKHLREPYFLLRLPLPCVLKEKIYAKKERNEIRAQKLLASCALCFTDLREETGIEFIHLNRNPCMNKRVILVDKLGISHAIAIDKYEFILQKRAIESKAYFTSLLALHDEEQIRQKLQLLLGLVRAWYEKGIMNTDCAFLQNVGFTPDGTAAVLFDIGQLIIAPEERNLACDRALRLRDIHYWAKDALPELLPYVSDYSRFPSQS